MPHAHQEMSEMAADSPMGMMVCSKFLVTRIQNSTFQNDHFQNRIQTHFYWGIGQEVLFEGWRPSSVAQYVAICGLVCLLAIGRELLLGWRARVMRVDADALRKQARRASDELRVHHIWSG